MLLILQQHDDAKLTKWVHEKLEDVLLYDVVNTYNDCGKIFFEIGCWFTTLPMGAGA